MAKTVWSEYTEEAWQVMQNTEAFYVRASERVQKIHKYTWSKEGRIRNLAKFLRENYPCSTYRVNFTQLAKFWLQ